MTISVLVVPLPALADTVTAKPQFRLVTSIEPLAKVAREILPQGQVQISVLMRPGQNPHHGSYTPSQVRNLTNADLVVWLGPQSEPRLADMLSRYHLNHLAVEQIDSVHLQPLMNGSAVTEGGTHHYHDDEGGHSETAHAAASMDLHLWLSVHNMQLLAEKLVQQIAIQMPDTPLPLQSETRAQQFIAMMESWMQAQQLRFRPLQHQAWLTGHHPWGYLSRALSLEEPLRLSLQPETGTSARKLVTLREQVKRSQVACLVLEPEARESLLEKVCPDCRTVSLDPLGRHDSASLYSFGYSSTYSAFMQGLADAFYACLSGSAN